VIRGDLDPAVGVRMANAKICEVLADMVVERDERGE
jgi:hypothetical protein